MGEKKENDENQDIVAQRDNGSSETDVQQHKNENIDEETASQESKMSPRTPMVETRIQEQEAKSDCPYEKSTNATNNENSSSRIPTGEPTQHGGKYEANRHNTAEQEEGKTEKSGPEVNKQESEEQEVPQQSERDYEDNSRDAAAIKETLKWKMRPRDALRRDVQNWLQSHQRFKPDDVRLAVQELAEMHGKYSNDPQIWQDEVINLKDVQDRIILIVEHIKVISRKNERTTLVASLTEILTSFEDVSVSRIQENYDQFEQFQRSIRLSSIEA